LFSSSSDIETATRQALDYGLHRGIPFGAICNGHQLIAFVASRQDGVPPLRGSALIFKSLQDMFERFHQMWDALSQPGSRIRKPLYGCEQQPSIDFSVSPARETKHSAQASMEIKPIKNEDYESAEEIDSPMEFDQQSHRRSVYAPLT